ncbi:fumarylacetoacetate hydrolase family protein [Agarivorans gilvus]|jgi:2-keto-4-pentenoate hydratase/2-oxohepta-3-ene-1,7-dioic acid hydratase in catechol pathway|uniref:Isomerase/hydrolase n=1 Tax=Agarivorans gilvus TaxID=680279 RepID=A0ABQ1HWK4_9ALTE|nr:fumarylacetoacetate hydrolase family protein [Agarivorans gilvus]GGA93684.1 isomerase/hydrolase [Agarivorans gilvus]
MYQHLDQQGQLIALPAAKAVCVGQNYLDHMQEMGGAPVKQAVFFIKPNSAFVNFSEQLAIPANKGEVHYELELALLINKPLKNATPEQLDDAVWGYALALDLTLRDIQLQLKQRGHPWERAKAFDNSCVLSAFKPLNSLTELNQVDLALSQNGKLKQQGNTSQMIRDLQQLLCEASSCFSLMPGDVLLTGTPAGVGPLHAGDQLAMNVADISVNTEVVVSE